MDVFSQSAFHPIKKKEKNQMKILTLSDLCWERKLQKIKNEEVKRFKEKDIEKREREKRIRTVIAASKSAREVIT